MLILFTGVGAFAPLHALADDLYGPKSLAETSQALSKIQKALKNLFGIDTVYVAGGTARAVLDTALSGKVLVFRDIDVFAAKNSPSSLEDAFSIGRDLQYQGAGVFDSRNCHPKNRGNPALPGDEGRKYIAGYGIKMESSTSAPLDVSLMHTEEDVDLNGIFNTDRVRIPLASGQTLDGWVAKARGKSFADLLNHGMVIDKEDGYRSWLRKSLHIVHWIDVEESPILTTIRIVRNFAKLGIFTIPMADHQRLAALIQSSDLSRENGHRIKVQISRLKTDANLTQELEMLESLGMVRKLSWLWPQALAQSVCEVAIAPLRLGPGFKTIRSAP